jgi:hypothetical protein
MNDDHGYVDEYKKLNKAQKEALDSIDGLVAGPGIGKTQVF